MKNILTNTTKTAYKWIVFWTFFWLTVFSVAYAASIRSTTDPTVTSWDSITASWYQDVNNKLGGISVENWKLSIQWDQALIWNTQRLEIHNSTTNPTKWITIWLWDRNSLRYETTWWEAKFISYWDYPMTFGTNAWEKMRIDSSGNVWIGFDTVYNNDRLYVDWAITAGTNWATNGSTLIQNRYWEQVNRYSNVLWTLYSSAAWSLGRSVRPKSWAAGYVSSNELDTAKSSLEVWSSHLSFKMAPKSPVPIGNDVAMTTAFHIDSAGKVWIWTTTPDYNLDILWDSPVLRIADDNVSNATNASALWFWENWLSEQRGAGFHYDGWSNKLYIKTSDNWAWLSSPFDAVPRMTIEEQTGNVWIWTTDPSEKLEVNWGIKASSISWDVITTSTIRAWTSYEWFNDFTSTNHPKMITMMCRKFDGNWWSSHIYMITWHSSGGPKEIVNMTSSHRNLPDSNIVLGTSSSNVYWFAVSNNFTFDISCTIKQLKLF